MMEGRLIKDQFGYNIPVDAPAFNQPPIYFKNANALVVTYETDTEAALDLLPQGLTLLEPASAVLMFIRYPKSTLGPYDETILGIPCLFGGELKVYIAHIVVNNPVGLLAGREPYGYPKKMAEISFQQDNDILFAKMERPAGNLICSAGIRLETPDHPEIGPIGVVTLRVIPSPEEGAPPSIAELVETPDGITPIESWSGTGWAQLHSTSPLDPWHKLPINNILDVNYRVYNSVLGYGRIIQTF